MSLIRCPVRKSQWVVIAVAVDVLATEVQLASSDAADRKAENIDDDAAAVVEEVVALFVIVGLPLLSKGILYNFI